MHEWDGERRLARLRQGLHRFFAATLLYPTSDRRQLLIEASGLLDHEGLDAFAFYDPWRRFISLLETTKDLHRVQVEYVRLFEVVGDGTLCPPYESFYLASRSSDMAMHAAQIEQEYARLGVAPTLELKSTPDHASAELEVMAFLCNREARAWEEGAPRSAIGTLRRQHAFLTQHLSRWFPLFARRAAQLSARARGARDIASATGNAAVNPTASAHFYRAALHAADAFITHEVDLVALLLKQQITNGQ